MVDVVLRTPINAASANGPAAPGAVDRLDAVAVKAGRNVAGDYGFARADDAFLHRLH